MAYSGQTSSTFGDLTSGLRSESREPGSRRKRLGEYLKAANEMRQSYFSGEEGSRDHDHQTGSDGIFPDAAVVRSGKEEMILFPSYGKRHVKSKLENVSGNTENEQDFWRREWDKHQNDTAVVDVDVRGWIYTPHRGPTTRRQRLFIGMARQLSGLPAPPSRDNSNASSRASSPNRFTKQEEDLISLEAEQIVRRGEEEERFARQGKFSEDPNKSKDSDSVYSGQSRPASPAGRAHIESMALADDPPIKTLQNRTSWQEPSKMSNAELVIANNHLLNRVRPFMANPLEESPISAFFYNENSSRQHTVYTNTSGHFTLRASLDFVPTHVRVFAGERLSHTEEVHITSSKGVSIISDIDDTIKHSAISAGAREIFRNAFIRDLSDLTIDGVREWYNTMSDMGVKMHYVSNSPWQMYPIITSFFKMAHLPKGSFHLKQYTGMLQGIFEPVAERKKSSMEKLMRDFPDRKFILIGDSGEADLEVYTDVALDNPGKVLGIFIRDVTTTTKTGYFDSSTPMGNRGRRSRNHSRHRSNDSLNMSKRISRPDDLGDEAALRAAIAASLEDMEAESKTARKSINPDAHAEEKFTKGDGRNNRPTLPLRPSEQKFVPQSQMTASPEEDLIDFSDPKPESIQDRLAPPSNNGRKPSDGSKSMPPPPPKPKALQSTSSTSASSSEGSGKQPPPRPRKPSSAVQPPSLSTPANSEQGRATPPQQTQTHHRSPLSQVTQQDSASERPPLPTRPKSYRGMAKDTIASVYNSLPSAPGWTEHGHRANTYDGAETIRSSGASIHEDSKSTKQGPPPPPPRRTMQSYPFTNTQRAPRPRSGAWDDESLASSPGEGMSKKEYLWQQRWARSRDVLEPRGVTLRTWRVGSDVADICVKLAEMAFRDIEKSEKNGKP